MSEGTRGRDAAADHVADQEHGDGTEGTPEERDSFWSRPLVWGVRLYQRFLSPLTPPSCRFYPSCSAYAVTALRRFGPLKGSWLATRRLLRCHPWNPGGVDHVPPRPSPSS